MTAAAPAGLVAWAIICFICVIIFTGYMIREYARPGTPPFALCLTYLSWLITFSICFLVPIDLLPSAEDSLNSVWNVMFWFSFLLMWYDNNNTTNSNSTVKAMDHELLQCYR